MYAIVDCNNFYCSCERLFEPRLRNKPIVVLSNNDGCIISRSDEAKELGMGMAGPYFLAKPLIEKHGVATFSSNYNLYGDMSFRVMETLRQIAGADNVEVYSVDESFVNLSIIPANELRETALYIKRTVEEWTGIPVSIGVAPSKTLAKLANRISKKNKESTGGVVVLNSKEDRISALKQAKVGHLWGVGHAYEEKLEKMGITTAFQLSEMPLDWAHKNMGGVVGMRLLKELQGIPAIQMDKPLVEKKMIATTRMFGDAVTNIEDIKEAVATYTSRAAEKLRRQKSAATMIHVFIVPKTISESTRFRHGPTVGTHIILPMATSITQELIKPAVALVDQLFEKGNKYKKAGIMLSGLVPEDTIQGSFFSPAPTEASKKLMTIMGNINFSQRDDVLKFAASGTDRDWKMRQELRSPRCTSRWSEISEVS